jgi:alpha-tubulin suppressor-like RCC1 family protein
MSATPVSVNGLTDVVEIVAGDNHACARTQTNGVWCWGANDRGQLGDGTTTDRRAPIAVAGLGDVVDLDARAFETCAVLRDGSVRCWGANGSGQLGDGSTTDHSSPVTVSGLTDAVEVEVGSRDACIRRSGGGVMCWGANSHGEIGDGSVVDRPAPTNVGSFTDAVGLELGLSHACGRSAAGNVVCWGSNSKGQIGDGNGYDTIYLPTPVRGLSGIAAGYAGEVATCATDSGGQTWCMGPTLFAPGVTDLVPTRHAALDGSIQIGIVRSHGCALRPDGTVSCWGTGGLLGDGGMTDSNVPVPVVGLTDAVEIGVGWFHSCARRATGEIVCWGHNDYGQCGNPIAGSAPAPVPVTGISGATRLAVGLYTSCVINGDGTVSCWGANQDAYCDDGTGLVIDSSADPNIVSGVSNATAIGVDNSQSCAIAADGTATCWNGLGYSFGCDDGTTVAPDVFPWLDGATNLSMNWELSCAEFPSGDTKCWGQQNYSGYFGDGVIYGTSFGGPVVGVGAIQTLSAGGRHACVAGSTGELLCWGDNASGQQGTGAFGADRSTPTAVVGLP